MKGNEKKHPPFYGHMDSSEQEPKEWNPPNPPWKPEPEPLISSTPDPVPPDFNLEGKSLPEAVNMGLESKVSQMVEDGDLKIEEQDLTVHSSTFYNGKPVGEASRQDSEYINGTEIDGFFFYRILSPSGITLNGTPYPQGSYWFNQETYGGIKSIDAPFQG